jgi:hypothetical protein
LSIRAKEFGTEGYLNRFFLRRSKRERSIMLVCPNASTVSWPRVAATFLSAACLSLVVVAQPMARPETGTRMETFRLLSTQQDAEDQRDLREAAKEFVVAMAQGNAEALWMFASEEEHAALQTKDAVLRAYREDFPALTRAKEAVLVDVWQEGDLPFVRMIVRDGAGQAYRAEIGLWLDDAGDWKIASLSIRAASDRTAGL